MFEGSLSGLAQFLPADRARDLLIDTLARHLGYFALHRKLSPRPCVTVVKVQDVRGNEKAILVLTLWQKSSLQDWTDLQDAISPKS